MKDNESRNLTEMLETLELVRLESRTDLEARQHYKELFSEIEAKQLSHTRVRTRTATLKT